MTDIRARRTAVLTAAAKAKSEGKTSAADQAIRRLVKRGNLSPSRPCSAKPASPTPSSTETLVCGRIEHLRTQARRPVPASDGNGDNTIIQALTSLISHLRNSTATRRRPCTPRLSRLTARTCNCAASSPASAGPQ